MDRVDILTTSESSRFPCNVRPVDAFTFRNRKFFDCIADDGTPVVILLLDDGAQLYQAYARQSREWAVGVILEMLTKESTVCQMSQ